MISVYVWKYRGKRVAWGHASMQVDRTYISWWPAIPGQIASGIHPSVYASHPVRNRSFAQDKQDEKQPPDFVVPIIGLDENAIKDWWQSFGLSRDGFSLEGPLTAWQTLRSNCSTVVATGLRRGGGDTFAKWTKSWNLVWTPRDVLSYAWSIQRGLSLRGR